MKEARTADWLAKNRGMRKGKKPCGHGVVGGRITKSSQNTTATYGTAPEYPNNTNNYEYSDVPDQEPGHNYEYPDVPDPEVGHNNLYPGGYINGGFSGAEMGQGGDIGGPGGGDLGFGGGSGFDYDDEMD